jgi:hypothetical protein
VFRSNMNASVRDIRYLTYWIDFDEILYFGRGPGVA